MRPTTSITLLLLVLVAVGCDGDGGDEDGDEPAGAGTAVQSESDAAAEEAAARSAALRARVKELTALARMPQEGRSRKEQLRIADAQSKLLAIAQRDEAAVAPLIAGLKKPDYDLIADLHSFYIQLGRPGTEKVIVEALNQFSFSHEGNVMAFALLGSGNRRLVQGARDWVESHGATVTGAPGGFGPQWGSGGGLPAPAVPTAPPP